jgi:hypothetical protein
LNQKINLYKKQTQINNNKIKKRKIIPLNDNKKVKGGVGRKGYTPYYLGVTER